MALALLGGSFMPAGARAHELRMAAVKQIARQSMVRFGGWDSLDGCRRIDAHRIGCSFSTEGAEGEPIGQDLDYFLVGRTLYDCITSRCARRGPGSPRPARLTARVTGRTARGLPVTLEVSFRARAGTFAAERLHAVGLGSDPESGLAVRARCNDGSTIRAELGGLATDVQRDGRFGGTVRYPDSGIRWADWTRGRFSGSSVHGAIGTRARLRDGRRCAATHRFTAAAALPRYVD